MDSDFIHRILRSLGSKETAPKPTQQAVDIFGVHPSPASPHDRRIDARFAIRTRCTYELVDGRNQEAVSPHGEAYSLNLSTDGILLLLDRQPQDRQLVAMRNPALQQRTVTLFEVRWLRHLPVGTTHKRYMVGCHLTFGRFPYFLVQRQHLDQHISGLML
ncbi:MAG TPA: hypothetical protein VM842_05825 [Nitrospira sp.]|jgi:hypothetical protein|nr:hypothetical protein [Nitrospira sp.]